MLAPGRVIGMLGGGQLGRMAALAAAPLGYHMHIFTPHGDDPAIEVSAVATVAAWDDEAALSAFAGTVDAITLEFENVPLAAVEYLARLKPVYPDAKALAVAQDRVKEKSFLNGIGVATAPWQAVDGASDLAAAFETIGTPSILKTARFGYDGKGQMRLAGPDEEAWQQLGSVPSILEGMVGFEREISVVLARGKDGATAAYPAVENRYEHGILAETIAPARISSALAAEAEAIATKIAAALDYVGVLAVEFFVAPGDHLLVNEIAPRPHNSGHWTLDACAVSQFEQQIRTTAGLPLGDPSPHTNAVMLNLIGDQALDWQKYVEDPAAHLHLYGKKEIRPGRKMGHVTRLLRA